MPVKCWDGQVLYHQFSSAQSLSPVRLFATRWTAAHQASLSITNSWSSPKLMSIESVMPSNHLIFLHPLLLLVSMFPCIRVLSNSQFFSSEMKYISLLFLILTQLSSVAQSCLTLCDPMDRSTLDLPITNSWSSPKLMSIESVMPSNHLILCHPLLLLPSIFPSIRVFSNESALRIRWTKYWSFSFSISPSNEHPGLISFRMDWLDLWMDWLQSKGLSRVFSNTTVQQHQFFGTQLSL